MAKQYKFKEPNDVVELDPNQGQLVTPWTRASVDYRFNRLPGITGIVDACMDGYSVELEIACQEFGVEDLDDLISSLQAAKDKLIQQNSTIE